MGPFILPKSGNQRPARIRCLFDLVSHLVLERDHRQITDVESAVDVTDSDIDGQRHGVVAHIQRVMTSAARSGKRGDAKVVVDAPHSGNVDRLRIEQRLSAGDGRTPALRVRPRVKQRKDEGRERLEFRVLTERIVDPDEERWLGRGVQQERSAFRSVSVEPSRQPVDQLRG